jgi:hypothetical protein
MACSALTVLALDVADTDSIQALPGLPKEQTLSLFINNTGVYGDGQSLEQVEEERVAEGVQNKYHCPPLAHPRTGTVDGQFQAGKAGLFELKNGVHY